MKISTSHIRYYQGQYNWSGNTIPQNIDALVDKIGAQLGAVEEVVDYGAQYRGILIVRIVACEDHPNADRLHVCKVDDGGKTPGVERDEHGYVQVVCGAPNVRAGLTVAWLPPGSTVPSSIASGDPFVLEARPLRGVVSNGMLASPRELNIGDSHEGIMEIDDEVAPGTPFAEHFGLQDDQVIDIENKMFTHRPDCFGMMGVAREIAGIQQIPFTSPDWWRADIALPAADSTDTSVKLEVRNELPALVPRFTALIMTDIKIKPSPVWLQIALTRLGVRPINNVVDLTNYNMLLTGQPLHAYDYDKVVAKDGGADHATLTVRYPREGEKITLLNGKQLSPRPEAIMIATRDTLIGVGGVMGGADTEVDDTTTTIILECASFDMYSIRRTSMAHGLFTDAVTRFNKGQSPLQNPAVIAKTVQDIKRLAEGTVAGTPIDDVGLPSDVVDRAAVHPPVYTSAAFINARLGLKLSATQIATLLTNVECRVEVDGEDLKITAPFWRTDIEIPEDVVEEVGRLYGYDHLPLELPRRNITPAQKAPLLQLKTQLRSLLAAAGANELLTYSFVHGNLLDKAGQNRELAFQLSNALSPDLQYYRVSLTPSLLEKVHPNIKAGYSEFALFELGKAHLVGEFDPAEPDVPKEVNALSVVFAADDKTASDHYEGAAYYQARRYLDVLLSEYGVYEMVRLVALKDADLYNNPWIEQMVAPFEPQRSAVLQDNNGLIWGVVGEFKPSVRKQLKLPSFAAGFEVDPLVFVVRNQPTSQYRAQPRFPRLEQDLCLKVPSNTPYKTVFDCAIAALQETKPDHTLATVTPVDIYQRDDETGHKQITLRFGLANYERTLTDEEVTRMLTNISQKARQEIGAQQI